MVTRMRIRKFIIRWIVAVLGLWAASGLLGNESISYGGRLGVILVAGFVLAVVNTIIKPVVIFLTLPAVLLTLGIFIIFINAAMVLLASWLYSPLHVSGFGVALIAGMVIGVVNWLVTALLEEDKK